MSRWSKADRRNPGDGDLRSERLTSWRKTAQNAAVLVVERYLDIPLPHLLSITFSKNEEACRGPVPRRRLFDMSSAILLSDSIVQDYSLTTNLAAVDEGTGLSLV
jgi:hypothetical protein